MKYILAVGMACLLTSCYQPTRNCKDYRTGKFHSEVVINGKVFTSNFTRNEKVQVETYDDHKDSSEVRWINDCEVVFRTIHPKNMAERKDVHLKILSTTDSSYTFEYSYIGETKKQKGVAYKVD